MAFLDLEKSIALDRHRGIMSDLYRRIANYHKRELHEGQIRIAKKYFVENKKIIQVQCGRSFGKSETVLYIAWAAAMLNDNFLIYIICPERTHAKKIYWISRRLQEYGPQEYVAEHRDSELIVTFKNGSKICLDGCENYNSLRGIKPNLVFYDEFQHHSREFDLEVMRPNLTAKKSSLIVVGTPPKTDCYYVEFRKNLLSQVDSGDNTRWYFEAPTWLNPIHDMAELNKIKTELIKAGDEKIWLREYEGKLIFGGEGAVFPYFDKRKHVFSHNVLTAAISKDAHKLKWFTICDPGTSSCFAVLFACYNPYTSQVYLLDEIYEKDRKKTDTSQIWARIKQIENNLYPQGKWRRYYDEAASWFQREVQANFRENLTPTDKRHRDDESDISLIKSLMSEDAHLFVSERCQKLVWEIENYVTDERGRYPDENDHLIDCTRYLMYAAGVKFINEVYRPEKRDLTEDFARYKNVVEKINPKVEKWDDNAVDQVGFYDDTSNWFDA